MDGDSRRQGGLTVPACFHPELRAWEPRGGRWPSIPAAGCALLMNSELGHTPSILSLSVFLSREEMIPWAVLSPLQTMLTGLSGKIYIQAGYGPIGTEPLAGKASCLPELSKQ